MINRFLFFSLLLMMPLPLRANEIQHVLGGAFQLLSVGVPVVIVLYLALPIIYYFKRKRSLAILLYVVGCMTCLLGLMAGLSIGGSGGIIVIGIPLIVAGAALIWLPANRKPL